MVNDKFLNAYRRVGQELAGYGVSLMQPEAVDAGRESMYVFLDPLEVEYCWSEGMLAYVEFGIGHSKNVHAVHKMMTEPKPDISEMTITEAEKRIGRLVYSILAGAGFSVSWDGEILSPMFLDIEEEFVDKEEESE